MEKTRRKINILGLIGVLLMVTGSGLIIHDQVTKYLANKEVKESIDNFFDEPAVNVGTSPVLADGDVFGTIEMPTVSTVAPIVQSANWDHLEKYVVAWPDRTLDSGNFSIAGHNGSCASCLFRDIHQLKDGDPILITTREAVYEYKVFKNFKVHYTDGSVLDDIEDKTTITLVTCEEAYVGSTVRVIIQAELVSVTPRSGSPA